MSVLVQYHDAIQSVCEDLWLMFSLLFHAYRLYKTIPSVYFHFKLDKNKP